MNQNESALKHAIKTGTTTLGIVCADGIIIAADKRTTLGGQIIVDRKTDKVVQIVDNIVITTAGMASTVERLAKVVRAELKLLEVKTNRKVTVKETANLLLNMNYWGIRQFGEWELAHFLVGGKDATGYHLFEVSADGTLKDHDEYAATGSGCVFVWPIIEQKYKKSITIQEGIKLAVEAINAAQLRDTASGSGFDVWTVTADGLKRVITRDITPRAEL
jgi:proteasome beta subunit